MSTSKVQMKNRKYVFFADIITLHLEEKFDVSVDEQGRRRITEHIKTELLADAIQRRISGENTGLSISFTIFYKIQMFV
jgi:hypothetical protein